MCCGRAAVEAVVETRLDHGEAKNAARWGAVGGPEA